MDIFSIYRGNSPLLISLPHNGTEIPEELRSRFTPEALRLPDTDWHVARLYTFSQEMGATLLIPRFSRYVIDLNRPPDGVALYPGQQETGLCPLETFKGASIYQTEQEPTSDEIRERLQYYWQPYHQALQMELTRLREVHGRVILWEGHSICSRVSRFFEGQLPDFNLGTASGLSCSSNLQYSLTKILADQTTFSWIVNGRFKGGYITRHYGQPETGMSAVQLELAQCIYMNEETLDYLPEQAEKVIAIIKKLLLVCLNK